MKTELLGDALETGKSKGAWVLTHKKAKKILHACRQRPGSQQCDVLHEPPRSVTAISGLQIITQLYTSCPGCSCLHVQTLLAVLAVIVYQFQLVD